MPTPTWNRVAIVGVGLIGGSIGLAVLQRRLAKHVIGIGRRTGSLAAARRIGAVTETTTNLKRGVDNADLIIICTPVEEIVPRVCEAAAAMASFKHGTPSVLITDVGSTKSSIVRLLDARQQGEEWPKSLSFVGSHPIAGNEKRGPQHGTGDLFEGRPIVVTPTENSHRATVRKLKGFWAAIGGKVTEMTAEAHDAAMAVVSHMPHLLASAIAGATPERYVSLSGTGWQDTTRIAAGDPTLWRQIFLANRENVLAALDGFDRQLAALRKALETKDGAALEALLRDAQKVRESARTK